MTILENKHMDTLDAVKYAAAKGIHLTTNDIETALTTPSRNAFCIPGQPDRFLQFLPLDNRVQVITAKSF